MWLIPPEAEYDASAASLLTTTLPISRNSDRCYFYSTVPTQTIAEVFKFASSPVLPANLVLGLNLCKGFICVRTHASREQKTSISRHLRSGMQRDNVEVAFNFYCMMMSGELVCQNPLKAKMAPASRSYFHHSPGCFYMTSNTTSPSMLVQSQIRENFYWQGQPGDIFESFRSFATSEPA